MFLLFGVDAFDNLIGLHFGMNVLVPLEFLFEEQQLLFPFLPVKGVLQRFLALGSEGLVCCIVAECLLVLLDRWALAQNVFLVSLDMAVLLSEVAEQLVEVV